MSLADEQMAFLLTHVTPDTYDTLSDLRKKYYDGLTAIDATYSVTDFELDYLKTTVLPLGPAGGDSISDFRRSLYYNSITLPNETELSNNDLQFRNLLLGNITP